MIVYILALVSLLVILPVSGLIFSIPIYFKAKKKSTIIISSILLGILVGYVAFNFIPNPEFDLTRHQNVVNVFSKCSNFDDFAAVSEGFGSSLEIIPQVISYFVSRFNNPDLLQFICVAIGYSAIFYILSDSKKNANLGNKKFIPLFILMLFGQSTLYYFSGLYNYMAISLFALAFYLDYNKKKKIPAYILYILLPFVHNSILFPLAFLMLYKICGNKFDRRFVIISIFSVLAVTNILSFMIDSIGITQLEHVRTVLGEYLSKNDSMQRFYSGSGLFIEILKAMFVMAVSFIAIKTKKDDNIAPYIFIFIIVTLIMATNSIVIIRFASLALYLCIVPITELLSKKDTISKYLLFSTVALAAIFAVYNIHTIYPYGYDEIKANILFKTWPEIFIK